MSESSGRLVVAADEALVADVLCVALVERGWVPLRWEHDVDLRASRVEVGLLVADLGSPVGRAYAERVLVGSAIPWVAVAGTPPTRAWLEARAPARIRILPSSVALADLVEALRDAAGALLGPTRALADGGREAR